MGHHLQALLQTANNKMMIQIVVLALASTALAEPEADAGYYYGRYFNHHYYNRGLYGYGYPRYGYHGYHGLWKRDADAQVVTPAATQLLPAALPAQAVTPFFTNPYVGAPVAPIAPVAFPAPTAFATPVVATTQTVKTIPAEVTHAASAFAPAPIVRATPFVAPAAPVAVAQPLPYTPHNCVSEGGCAALTLRLHGLAKREAEAEATAEADADAEAFWYGQYYNNPYTYNSYNPYTFGAYPYAYPTAAPVVKAAEVPAPVVKAAPVALPAPVAALPAPYVAAPIVRAPIVEPVVVEKAKKVTYTHLGAHPLVNPATILEKTGELEVVGHRVY